MSTITVSGLGSGLDYNSWITQLVALKQADIDKVSAQVTGVKSKESAESTIESDYSSLKTALQAFTQALSTTDVFKQKTATSSSSAITASVTSSANTGTVNVSVDSLATATKAQSSYTAGAYINSSTKLSDIPNSTIKAGTFSVYVGGAKNSINITDSETVGDVVNALNGISGVSASLSSDGKLTIAPSGATAITIGSNSDTSNFSNVMALSPVTNNGVTSYTSIKSLFATDSSAALTSTPFRNSDGTSASVRAGTFSIGGTSFTIDSSTTLDDLITEINSSDAGVTAGWDANIGKMSLVSKNEGAVNIDVQAGTSNFTDVMGLTTSTWTENSGVYTLNSTQLNSGSQTLGSNAKLTINGTTVISTSNTITSDISGVKGLTLNLTNTTSSAQTVTISQDTSAVSNALTKVVNSLNTLITDSNTATATNGELYGESILVSLKNKLRTITTAGVNTSGSYASIADLGITTGAVGASVSANTNKLTIDTARLTTALTADPDSAKKLLLGDSSTGANGVLNDLEAVLSNANDAKTGYFVTTKASNEKQISRLNDKIDTMTTKLTAYKTQLEKKFQAMDTLISNLKNSASVFDSYFNKSSSSSSSGK